MATLSTEHSENVLQEQIRELLTSRQEFLAQLDKEVAYEVGKPAFTSEGLLDARSAYDYLDRCRRYVENALRKVARNYSPFEWLWYLRRVPETVFAGKLLTTAIYDRFLAETAGAIYGDQLRQRVVSNAGLQINFPVEKKAARKVFQLCLLTIYLSNIHSSLRYAGKGVCFGQDEGILLPVAKPTEEEMIAISSYDRRIEKQTLAAGYPLAGTIGGTIAPEDQTTDENLDITLLGGTEPHDVEVEDEDTGLTLAFHTRFGTLPVSLAHMAALNQGFGRTWWPEGAAALLVLLRACPILLDQWRALQLRTPLSYGYMLVSEERLDQLLAAQSGENKRMIERILGSSEVPNTATELLAQLDQLPKSLWPLIPGGATKGKFGNQCLIDWHAASLMLPRIFEYPRADGDAGNVRADHFEPRVQEIINSTKWSPSPDLLEKRGKPLKRGGKTWTDFDAVGEFEDTLLMVDCISILHDSEYDKGDWNRVTAAESRLIEKQRKWSEKKKELQADFEIDGLDLSRFRKVIAVVCSPQPFYVRTGSCTADAAPGLPNVVTTDELMSWLNADLTASAG
jgi:hypothetical protein